jgi:hypothetical protein
MVNANRQIPFYVKCVKAQNCDAGTGKSADHQSDLLRAACRLFCIVILTVAAAQVSESPPFFRSSRTAFDFVCQARLATDK